MSTGGELAVLDELVKQAEELTFLRKIKLSNTRIVFRIRPIGRFEIDAGIPYSQSSPYWELELEEGMIYGDSFPVGAKTIKQAFIFGVFMLEKRRQSNTPQVVSTLDPEFHEQLEKNYINNPTLFEPIRIPLTE